MTKGKFLDIKANNPEHPRLMDQSARDMLLPSLPTNRHTVLTLVTAYTSMMLVQVLQLLPETLHGALNSCLIWSNKYKNIEACMYVHVHLSLGRGG